MSRPRIAMLTLEYPPRVSGGAGILATRIAQSAARFGAEVHVLTPGRENRYVLSTEEGVRVHRLPSGPFVRWMVPYYWMILPRWFKRIGRDAGGFDLVHGYGIADLTLRLAPQSRPRIVTVFHLAASAVKAIRPGLGERLRRPGDEIGLGPALETICIRRADFLTTISGFTRSDLIASLGVDSGKVRVIRLGTDLDGYRQSAEDRTALRKQLGVGDRPMILFVGRLEPRKGVAPLIEAFSLLAERRPAVLVVAGAGNPDPYIRLADERGVGQRVIFAGPIPSPADLKKMYSACDLVAAPSLFEGLGLTPLEARAAGKFTIASRTGGLPEVVPEGSGYLVPPGDPAAFADAMDRALGEEHPAVAAPPSWRETEAEYYRFYEEMIGQGGSWSRRARRSVGGSKP